MIEILVAALALSAATQDLVRPATPEEAAEHKAAIARLALPGEGDWRVVWRNPGRAIAVDVAHVQSQGSMRTVWVALPGAVSPVPPETYALTKLELDCASGEGRPLWYGFQSLAGPVLAGSSLDEVSSPLEPGAAPARVAAAVCADQPLEGPGFPTHQAFAAATLGGQ